jgi:hypothetical protein
METLETQKSFKVSKVFSINFPLSGNTGAGNR